MLIKTKYFGEINLEDEKIITFDEGIMGFEEFKKYTIIYDIESKEKNTISWLQSVENPGLALPVINPFIITETYNPIVNDDILDSIGELKEEDIVVLLALTVPSDIKKMTANLKAPFIINSATKKGCQIIVENQDYQIKYPIYEQIEQMKKKKGE